MYTNLITVLTNAKLHAGYKGQNNIKSTEHTMYTT